MALYDALDQKRIFQRQLDLDNDILTRDEVEELDATIGDQGDKAEKKCRPRRPENYSNTIVRQRFQVSILRRHLTAVQKDQDRNGQLIQKMRRTGIFVELPATQPLTRKALRNAKAELQETRANSFQIRQAEMHQRLQELSGKSEKPTHKIVSAIRKVEANLKTYRILKDMQRTKETTSALDRLEVPRSWPDPDPNVTICDLEDPKTCSEWKTITEPSAVEQYLLLRNRQHFGQAEGTPFTIPPLSQELDWFASSPAAEELLQGEFEYQGDHPQLDTLLKACTSAAPADSVPAQLSMEEFRGKIQTWRESSPQCCHV